MTTPCHRAWFAAAVTALSPLAAAAVPPTEFSCGPFLQRPAATTMTIVVDHESPLSAALTYRRADGVGKARTVAHVEAARHHVYALEGLEPDTRYGYRVQGGGGQDSGEREFRTLPQAPRHYRFAAFGDVRTNPDVWRRVARRIHDQEPDALFLVGTGDYPADGHRYDQWVTQFFDPARDLLARLPLWPAIGNHERTRPHVEPAVDAPAGGAPTGGGGEAEVQAEGSHYFDLFELPGKERWYRVDYRYLTLLVLDSTSPFDPGNGQYEWLREQLRSERGRFTVAAFHHDPIGSGPHGGRLPDGTPSERAIDEGLRFLVPLFEIYGVDLVLNGHDHLYERSCKEGIYYVVTGGGGAPLYRVDTVENPYQQVALSTNHYLTVDVDPASLTVTAVADDGARLDWFVVPVAERTARRWEGLALERVRAATQPSSEAGAVTCRVTNPLAFPVALDLSLADSAAAGPPQRQVLQPGESAQLRQSLASDLPGFDQPAWRGRVATAAVLRVTGNDDGLPLAGTVVQDVTLREARFDAPRMPAPAVDGSLAEWPDDTEAMVLDAESATVVNDEVYSGDGDLRVAVRAGWSAVGLHLAFAVDDDALTDAPGLPVWENDGVELFVDGRPEAARTARYGPGVSQLILPAMRPVEGEGVEGNNAWAGDAFAWAVRSRAGGYDLEATLPFASIRSGAQWTPAVGDTIRFDAMVNDRDESEGEASHHRLWSTGSAASRTTGFGVLVLGE